MPMLSLAVLPVAALAVPPATAQQLSATVVSPTVNGTFYYADGKVRFGVTLNGAPGFLIADASRHQFYAVIPSKKLFFRSNYYHGLKQFFVPTAIDDPCPGWDAILRGREGLHQRILRCGKVGEEPVAGRPAVKYQFDTYDLIQHGIPNRHWTAWVDPALKFTIKIKVGETDWQMLQNIQIAPQPPELFDLPQGYQEITTKAYQGFEGR